ncbi:CtsR family transcriptional regulator [Alicyclobacillus ferrooxydans]|uniref:Transcriptional regulator CtsR n=1 Tax=Alicyclobacillus ferrooxydans TaxID=471514 RepID=A0A0N8PPF5_9BACL|nr:CtsR family transcriptional regulator [Alicyclobacillus ferrooxydans]KPV44181.1 transcriptional regulator [Alicyclobacillus ferrooxydans]
MARNISDVIERYLKHILEQGDGLAELQRSELAELFQCVPSQINYVIATRFSLDHGYLVESKRGGGGYIRIRKVELEQTQPLLTIAKSISSQVTQREADGIIERLYAEGLLTDREAALLKVVTSREVLLVDLPLRDQLRAKILAQCLVVLSVTD